MRTRLLLSWSCVFAFTHQYESYDGLNGAYTYSDMTGAGLENVAFPQG